MPLSENVRVEVYLPDLPTPSYRDLLKAFEREFTYAFGGCTIVRGLDGSYLSQAGFPMQDKVNIIFTDLPLRLEQNLDRLSRYTDNLSRAAFDSLDEETVLVTAFSIYHADLD